MSRIWGTRMRTGSLDQNDGRHSLPLSQRVGGAQSRIVESAGEGHGGLSGEGAGEGDGVDNLLDGDGEDLGLGQEVELDTGHLGGDRARDVHGGVGAQGAV